MVSVPDLDIDSPAGNLAIRLICRSAVRHAEISVLFLVCLGGAGWQPPRRGGRCRPLRGSLPGMRSRHGRSGRGAAGLRGGLRFAFYGRVSTEDYQDPVTSRARQLGQAAALVAGYGRITAEYFDAGQSRVLPWARRPQAAALVAAMADLGRGFVAVVIGEYERAFYGSQYALMAPLFEHYGVQLWMPEAGGPVDFSGEGHEEAMLALGIQSKREITRTRIRVRTAMAAL